MFTTSQSRKNLNSQWLIFVTSVTIPISGYQGDHYVVAPGLPPLVGEAMDRTVRVWTQGQEFEPIEMLTPAQWAAWCCKFGRLVMLRFKQGNGFGLQGFPNNLPSPFPPGS